MIRFSVHYFLIFTVMATVYPYFQIFLRERGFSESELGHLQGLLALAGICGPLVVGHVADRLGAHRRLIAACLAAFGVFILLLGMTSSFWLAGALAAGIGFVLRPTIPLTDTLAAAELSDPVHQYGKVRAWGSGGFMAVLLAVRVFGLVDEGSAASMMRAMLVATGFCVASSLWLPASHRTPEPLRKGEGRDRGHFGAVFWLFLLAVALQRFGMAGYYSFITIYLHDVFGMEQAAWVWALGAAAEMPVMFFAGRIIRRFGIRAMLTASMVAASARLAIFALAPVLSIVLASQVLHALTFGVCHAASIEFLRRKVPPRRRGLAMALYMSLALGVPSWLGSALGGEIIERWGYSALYLAYAAVPLVGVAVLATVGKDFARFSHAEG